VILLVPEAGFFNIWGWLSQKFGSNAASRLFFDWLTAYTKFGLNSAHSHRVAFRSCTFCFSSSKALKLTLLNTLCTEVSLLKLALISYHNIIIYALHIAFEFDTKESKIVGINQ